MRSRISNAASVLAGVVMALASATGHATVTTYFGTQAPKTPLSVATPPSLTGEMALAFGGFTSGLNVLGRGEFEGGTGTNYGATAGSSTFTYTGGTATMSGGATVTGASTSAPSGGRYNMTQGVAVDTSYGSATGHWLEASQSFTYNFSALVSAFGFFATDVGDLKGTFSFALYSGDTLIYSRENILNPQTDAQLRTNGNLLFLGVLSDIGFDRAVFSITQSPTATSTDILGFDSLIIGNRLVSGDLPEPTSLALVGLALFGLGAIRKRGLNG